MTFWAVIVFFLCAGLGILLVPLLRVSRRDQADQRLQQNIGIAREQRHQLDWQLEAGEIDQADYDSAFIDLQTSLALGLKPQESGSEKSRGTWMALVVLVLVPALSLSLYSIYGEYHVIGNPQILQAIENPVAQQHSGKDIDGMLQALQLKLQQNPEDASGWYMLGRSLMAIQSYDEAVVAFQRTYELTGDEPAILFSLADALTMQNGGNLLGTPEKLLQRGLKIAPRDPKGLWLAGLAAEQRKDYSTAHRYWTTLLPLVSDDQASLQQVQALIGRLEQRNPDLVPAAGVIQTINLEVDITPKLKNRANPNDTVFVYARAAQGPPMPLAVKKLKLSDLPATVVLSDNDAMIPSMKLSSFDQLILGARVSRSGKPVPQPGDFFTEINALDRDPSTQRITLQIDRVK